MLARVVAALFFVSALATPALGSAQDPEWRVDVMLPRVGFLYAARDGMSPRGSLVLEMDLRVAHSSGHGLSLRAGLAGDVLETDYALLEADYLYRLQLWGNQRLGLALDLGAGVSGGDSDDCDGLWSCTDGPGIDGARIGGNAGSTLVFHAYGFTVDFDLRYRALAPLDSPQSHERFAVEHLFSAALGLGFGFW